MIIESYTEWTEITPVLFYRIWQGRIWQKELSPYFYGGSRIMYIGVNTLRGQEWIKNAEGVLNDRKNI